MPKKAFFEITNVCNLNCSFCHKTKREKGFISPENFRLGAQRVRPFADYLYFHLMGEPLLHPRLSELLDIGGELGFREIITTNGTLLPEKGDILLSAPSLKKVSISLHCYEANEMGISMEEYLCGCFEFCRRASEKGKIGVLRLWNLSGECEKNEYILERMRHSFGSEWKELYSGYKLCEGIFLEWGERFEWPDVSKEYLGCNHSCYGLRDQIGVHWDGTVVPCCLDADGAIPLGNIFTQSLEEILGGERAERLRLSLQRRRPCEELCRRCSYAIKKGY